MDEKRKEVFLGFGLEYHAVTSKSADPRLTSSSTLQIPLFLWYVSEWHHPLPSVPRKRPLALPHFSIFPFLALPNLFLGPTTFAILLISNAFRFIQLYYFRPWNYLDWIITITFFTCLRNISISTHSAHVAKADFLKLSETL